MSDDPVAVPPSNLHDQAGRARPSLSLVVPTRHAWETLAPHFDQLLPELRAVGAELVVVGLGGITPTATPAPVRAIADREPDMLRLRLRGLREARGAIVALGEDHSFPAPGWPRAVVQAHAEHEGVPAIVGCLVNAADRTVAGRANFLAFAGKYAPPLPVVPDWRPPPLATLSFKHDVLDALDDRPGSFDGLANRLFEEGQMIADDRVVILHDQDLGVTGSIRNAFTVTRAAYGYATDRLEPGRRSETIRWVVTHLPSMVWHAARDSQPPTRSRRAELMMVAVMAGANAAGAVVGALAGPGRSPNHYE